MIGRSRRRLNPRHVLVGLLTLAMVTALASLGGVGYGFPLRAQYHAPQYVYATFTVNSTGDGSDTNLGDGICDAGGGNCTLRAAIQSGNVTPGADEIGFDIPGPGPHTITPASALPTIVESLFIDATTEPDFAGTPVVVLDGSGAPSSGPFVNGLTIAADDTTIRGLVINRFDGNGIFVLNADDNTIDGNYIGTDVTGTVDRGNVYDGVILFGSSNNVVGGTSAAARNVISGNNDDGLSIVGASASNLIEGNYIGTTATGGAALGNSAEGIFGGGSGSAVTGNRIHANVISANSGSGVRLNDAGTAGNLIDGNAIGTDAARANDLGNGQEGVFLDGGTSANEVNENVISGNGLDGVLLSSAGSGNALTGNKIGTDGGGTANIGNSSMGVRVVATPGVGIDSGHIGFNGSAGVLVNSGNATITGNAIFSNGGLGIDLAPTGVNPNDAGDADTGPNGLQNYPVLTSAISAGGATTVQGTLNSTPNTVFQLHFYGNSACDPSGYGEGESFENSANAVTDATGNATFTVALTVPAGDFVTATATPVGSDGTSEFSACLVVSTAPEAIGDVGDMVDDLLPPGGTADSLTAKLDAAAAALTRGQTKTACNNLNAFENEVRAQSGKKIPAEAAGDLIDAVDAVEDAIDC